MAKSLLEKDPKSFLYIFAFDDECKENLEKISIPNTKVISLKEFETPQLLSIKSTRTAGEYCWTCTPWIIKHCLEKYNIGHCTYVDADLYFFENPQPLLDEANKGSVLLTEHRYSKRYDQTKTSGRFCVQFLKIKKDENGLAALNWWADRCIEWCYARTEDGKFGDQMYLDDWETRFNGVHVLKHLGGGVAPWNFEKYRFVDISGQNYKFQEISTGSQFNLIFYHFHEVKLRESKLRILTNYYLPSENFLIHKHYYRELEIGFNFLTNFNINSEKHSDLTINLLENIYEEREDSWNRYTKGKRRLFRLWLLSVIVIMMIFSFLFVFEYFYLIN
ncbi:glycosyl transferase [Leptospira yanagawae]|uniref:Glycosyl transferase n=1 Tax=Leptospira yanagawae TaxID=293069 RepID=A0ABY2M076_9LEPT|nr:glycosyl transferase [Leptospira yanagawae]TGL16499.1 glycosyl transferase [Leptospira yanagawae]